MVVELLQEGVQHAMASDLRMYFDIIGPILAIQVSTHTHFVQGWKLAHNENLLFLFSFAKV